jgi:hypothetical protein
MKRLNRSEYLLPLYGALTVAAAVTAVGCNKAGASDASTAKVKEQLSNPKKFDINDVPPDKRDMVRALMRGNGPSQPGAGGAKAAPAVKPASAPK